MSRLPLSVIALVSLAATPAMAQTRFAPGANATGSRSPLAIQQTYQYRLANLREKIVRQKAADGGRLTSDSLAYFQRQLDRLNDARLRDLRNADVWSVDATGKSVRS